MVIVGEPGGRDLTLQLETEEVTRYCASEHSIMNWNSFVFRVNSNSLCNRQDIESSIPNEPKIGKNPRLAI